MTEKELKIAFFAEMVIFHRFRTRIIPEFLKYYQILLKIYVTNVILTFFQKLIRYRVKQNSQNGVKRAKNDIFFAKTGVFQRFRT